MKKQEEVFKGFTPQTIQFFQELEENNYKEWFEEHRSIYEKELLKPLRSLVAALTPVMYNIDPSFELRPHRVMSRIYRDIRFSHNKDPYKTHMWITFQPVVENWANYPGYFMSLSAEGYNYGMGLYQAKKKKMDDIRDKIEYDAEEFEKYTRKNVTGRGFEVCGENYKRPVSNNLPEYFQDWYQKKSVYVWKKNSIGEELFSDKLATILEEDFIALEWLYNFLKED